MKIQIAQPVALHEAGSRDINEDFIYPLLNNATAEDRLFVVCDGEGGPRSGDEAAKMAALSLAKYLVTTPPGDMMDQEYLDLAIARVEMTLLSYKEEHPESRSMALSMALAYLGNTHITLAWIGTCRAYFYDADKELLLLPEESRDAKATGARITGSEVPQRLNVRHISYEETGRGDCLFISSDGVSEHVDDRSLTTVLKTAQSSAMDLSLEEIRALSQNFTQDNYSCYLVLIDKVENEQEAPAALPPVEEPVINEERAGKLIKQGIFAMLGLLLVSLVALAWWATRKTDYDRFMARAEESLKSKNFQEAIVWYDSAVAAQGATAEDKSRASGKRGEAMSLLSEQIDNSPETLIENAGEFLRLGNYEQAIESFRKAQDVTGADSNLKVLFPAEKMGEALIRRANQLYEAKNRDCNQIAQLYAEGLKIFASAEAKSRDNALISQAQKQQLGCEKEMAEAAKKGGSNIAAATPSGTNPAARERSVAPQEAAKPKTQTSAPASSASNTSAAERTRTVAAPATGSSDAATPAKLSAAETKALKAEMADGKRLYEQAKASGSSFEYKAAAQHLERAAPVLDGEGSYLLAYLYRTGLGVKKDDARAIKYAQRSANQNWPSGQYLYGKMLLDRGGAKDRQTAIQVLQKAANQNNIEAINLLKTIR
ncbi:MAG: hypothetical protein EAZ89_18505 [Bacteroidetes bacterium]|nr:MAG: hypothetical protein EAZ89_18505 [Bacteroidota bacterium]